jgi:hypothetical protein
MQRVVSLPCPRRDNSWWAKTHHSYLVPAQRKLLINGRRHVAYPFQVPRRGRPNRPNRRRPAPTAFQNVPGIAIQQLTILYSFPIVLAKLPYWLEFLIAFPISVFLLQKPPLFPCFTRAQDQRFATLI